MLIVSCDYLNDRLNGICWIGRYCTSFHDIAKDDNYDVNNRAASDLNSVLACSLLASVSTTLTRRKRALLAIGLKCCQLDDAEKCRF